MNLLAAKVGDRVTMLSGPYKGRAGRRDYHNGTFGSTMILVRFDGDTSFSLVSQEDKIAIGDVAPAPAKPPRAPKAKP